MIATTAPSQTERKLAEVTQTELENWCNEKNYPIPVGIGLDPHRAPNSFATAHMLYNWTHKKQ